MSEKALHEIDTEKVTELTVHDNNGADYTVESETVIGAERDGDELKIWIDSGIQ